MTTTVVDGPPVLGTLARHEIRRYAVNKLFWFGAVVSLAEGVVGMFSSDRESSTMYVIGPAAMLGVLGLVVMIGLARGSDLAAEAAGAVSVPERVRTLALATAVVVPVLVGLICWLLAVVAYFRHPPAVNTVPVGVIGDGYVLAVMFALGVMPCLGGPLLGLVLARWASFRGVAPIASVLLVLVTVLLQGILPMTRSWRVVWPWTYFFGPFGVEGDSDRWLVLTGSPWFYLGDLAVLCGLGVLVAVYHDPEADRVGLRRALVVGVVVAVTLVVLTAVGGVPETVNPLGSG